VNSARHLDVLTIYIISRTRRTQLDKFDKIGVRNTSSLLLSFPSLPTLQLNTLTLPPRTARGTTPAPAAAKSSTARRWPRGPPCAPSSSTSPPSTSSM
jgi:hypothetical protein